MTNEYIDHPVGPTGYPVGTVLKENSDNSICYYIVGEYFVYCKDYYYPAIRPWKFDTSKCTIADEDEKKEFIETLKKNHLIWDEETGKVEREYEEITLSVKVKVQPGMDIDKLLERLNDPHNEHPWYIHEIKYEDF